MTAVDESFISVVFRGLLIQVVPGRARILGSELVENRCGFATRAVTRTAKRSLAVAVAKQ